jgi:dethiobiotin synthetase
MTVTALFVIGTDTGVGKTVVSASLLAAVVARGGTASAFKPAESGCMPGPSGPVPTDAELLRRAAGGHQDLADVCPYRFEAEVAPGVAAERAGAFIDFERVAETVSAARTRRPDLLVVEGAGGLLVPFGAGRTTADLAARLELPLLVVARAGLGTINHTLLTVEVARARGLRVAAVVLNDPAPTGEPAELVASNAEEIERACQIPVLGPVPRLPQTSLLAYAKAGKELIEHLVGHVLAEHRREPVAPDPQLVGDDLERTATGSGRRREPRRRLQE